jgi:hypothetical protein
VQWFNATANWTSIQGEHAGLGQVYFTGFGVGGTLGALASMWLEKKDGVRVPTYTFGAPGTQCLARQLPDMKQDLLRRVTAGIGKQKNENFVSYLDDVDPYKTHPHIVDYTNRLDDIGNQDYDPGRTCLFGGNPKNNLNLNLNLNNNNNLTHETNAPVDLQEQRNAWEYCARIVGYKGAVVMTAGTMDKRLSRHVQQCRYFSHWIWSYYKSMQTQTN